MKQIQTCSESSSLPHLCSFSKAYSSCTWKPWSH